MWGTGSSTDTSSDSSNDASSDTDARAEVDAAGSEASLSLIGGGDPNEFDTFATRKTEEPERTPEDPEIKVDRGKRIKLRMLWKI